MNQRSELTIIDGETEKTFVINKMNALDAEEWLTRAGLMLGSAITSINGGENGEGYLKALASIDYDKAKPLLDKLLSCCSIVSGELITQLGPNEAKTRIESPMTLLKLRIEAFKFNFGFLLNGGQLASLIAPRS